MSGILTMQLEQLRERFGEAHSSAMASGTTLVTVPGVRLPEGWSRSSTTIRFLVPPGYPFAQLDCLHELRHILDTMQNVQELAGVREHLSRA